MVTHGDAREEKWRGKRRMEWVASSLQLDSLSKKASTRLNWHPSWYKWTRPFRWKTESGFCACAVTVCFHSNFPTEFLRLQPTNFFKRYKDSLEQNVHYHNYNTQKNWIYMFNFAIWISLGKVCWIWVLDSTTKCQINKILDKIKSLKRTELLLLQHAFYSVHEFMPYRLHVDCMNMWIR